MKELTDITIILDRSGSMQSVRTDTIGGFNSFLGEQQKVEGEGVISLYQFDHEYEPVYEALPLKNAQQLTAETFVPRGNTALFDAIGRTVNALGARLGKLSEDERPNKVVVVILTDGQENASHEFNSAQVSQMITHQKENYNWDFVFLGANQDAIASAKRMGIHASNAMSYAANRIGTRSAFDSVSRNLSSYRKGVSGSSAFNDEDRELQKKAGVKH